MKRVRHQLGLCNYNLQSKTLSERATYHAPYNIGPSALRLQCSLSYL